MHLINNLLWHGQGGPVSTINPPTSVKADEIVTPLSVSGGSGSNGTDSVGTHPIVMFLVSLNIITKFDSAVCVEVKTAIENDLGGALCVQNAPLSGNMLRQKTCEQTISIMNMGGR